MQREKYFQTPDEANTKRGIAIKVEIITILLFLGSK